MLRKCIFLVLLFAYVYTTTFNIFMTGVFRIPAPVVFVTLLLVFYKWQARKFTYWREIRVFFVASFLYYLLGQADITSFFATLILIVCFALLFNYIIDNNTRRLHIAIGMFYGVLLLSGLIMLADHQTDMTAVRSNLVGETILQSPSGISSTIFTFGYQLAALTPFLVIAPIVFKKMWPLSVAAFCLSFILIFYGMQRSALLAFAGSLAVFSLLYFRYKSVLIFGCLLVTFMAFQSTISSVTGDKQQNILNKNEQNQKKKEERGGLMAENIQIIQEYPFGLMFYGKSWNDVVQHNFVYKSGGGIITSHNAYLMFMTYLGPLLGLVLLVLMYSKVGKIIYYALVHIHERENALIVCLCFSFISISVNSCFHNEWLLSSSGPTLFLYFSILQLAKIKMEASLVVKSY